MINDFNDFCLWMYFVVDDIWLTIAPFFKRPGPAPDCPDSELLAMALIGECRGWDVETELLSYWQEHRDLFPKIPTQSRFNRRRRGLMQAFNMIRRVVLQSLDVAQDHQCVIDSLPASCDAVLSRALFQRRLESQWFHFWESIIQKTNDFWLQIASLDCHERCCP